MQSVRAVLEVLGLHANASLLADLEAPFSTAPVGTICSLRHAPWRLGARPLYQFDIAAGAGTINCQPPGLRP